VANSRSGNLFEDRYDPKLRWYLPQLELVADPDREFAFKANVIGQDTNADQFNTGTLTLSLRKSVRRT